MGKLVSESGDLAPTNTGMGAFQGLDAVILEGLPNNFQIAQDGIANDTVFQKATFVE